MTEAQNKKANESKPLFLIWSNQHGAWWRPNSQGYTGFAKSAGLYTLDEAKSISWQGRDGWGEDGKIPDELVVSIDVIPEIFRPDGSGGEK